MLLTISTTHKPATDLGYLLHKNPARTNVVELNQGKAYVFYPEVSEERCTAALMLEIDPVQLVRGKGQGDGAFDQYVNDRPYVASSLMSVAISNVFGTAMSGRSKERPELADQALPFEVRIPVLPGKGGEEFLRSLFEPLGYEVDAKALPLDEKFPEWGGSRYFDLILRGTVMLRDLLKHLYVLIPVLDATKHYWVDKEEIEKLLSKGKGWLESHPAQRAIVERYLLRQKNLTQVAIDRLMESEGAEPDEEVVEEQKVRKESLHDQRLVAVFDKLRSLGARKVLDLGCGEGKLLRLLLEDRQFEEILGVDVSYRSLEIASRRLKLDRMPPMKRKRINLAHGSLVYRDARLKDYDAAAVVEVIEHLDLPRLEAFERALFEDAKPKAVVLTTPNKEYNALFEGMSEGSMRHYDHRFEWTRAEFRQWCERVGSKHGYAFEIEPLGPVDEVHGAPSQLATFTL